MVMGSMGVARGGGISPAAGTTMASAFGEGWLLLTGLCPGDMERGGGTISAELHHTPWLCVCLFAQVRAALDSAGGHAIKV